MCLDFLRWVEKSCGIGYKLVRKSDVYKYIYYPYFSFFRIDGCGGVMVDSYGVLPTKTQYELNKLTIADREEIKLIQSTGYKKTKTYETGIHLYKNECMAICDLMHKREEDLVIIKCFYIGAYAQNGDSIVVDAVTVLNVLQLNYDKILRKE